MNARIYSLSRSSKRRTKRTAPHDATHTKTTATRTLKARKPRVLVIAHNHPMLSPGGAEILAHDVFQALNRSQIWDAYFMGATGAAHHTPHENQAFLGIEGRDNEWLFFGDGFDYFLQSQALPHFLSEDFARLLRDLAPDIVHFHHTMRIGVEALAVVKRVLPQCKIIYTLHEFLLMCHRDGQMITRPHNRLCNEATPSLCHRCFPEIPVAQFALRTHFIQTHLQQVDCFISPSHFLAERFIAWGIPAEKMHVIENGRTHVKAAPQRPLKPNAPRNRFGYFGQITPYKGVLLLLEAIKKLRASGSKNTIHLDIYGSIDMQPEPFQQSFFSALEAVSGQVHFHGRYRNEDMPSLMANLDWVLVPSTWWENSPLVIQEAFMHRRPVICSDIGGMAEKVQHGINGLHFTAGNADALARTLQQAIASPSLHTQLVSGIAPPPSIEECAAAHSDLYHAMMTLTAKAAAEAPQINTNFATQKRDSKRSKTMLTTIDSKHTRKHNTKTAK